MKRILTLAAVAALALPGFAGLTGGFGLDAFNRAISGAAKGNAVFSPSSFEFDCVVFSEAFGALTRAKIAESMGVLNGLEPVYQPIYEQLSNSPTNFSFLTARAFCLQDERKTHPAYRQWMQRTFAAEAFSFDFKKGAECWFRARMDGDMEDFALPEKAVRPGYYSYYDLVSVYAAWKEPFPTSMTKDMPFRCDDGAAISVKAMSDLRLADIWERKNYTAIRLPMAYDSWFFAILPKEGKLLSDIRTELNSTTLVDFMAGFKSITEAGLSHDAAFVSIPLIDITTTAELRNPFEYFRFPMTGMDRMEKGVCPRFVQQRTRFRLDETGPMTEQVIAKPFDQVAASSPTTRKFALDRPFVFFIYIDNLTTIPVVGQFTGR